MSLKIIYFFFFNTVYCWTSLNYTIYQVTAFNSRERSVLYNLQVKNDHLFFLNGVTNEAAQPMTIIAQESQRDEFERTLIDNDIEFIRNNKDKVMNEFRIIDDQHYMNRNYVYEKTPRLNTRFLDYVHITTWINNKLKKHSSVMQKMVVGDTFEKREIFVLKMSTGVEKPAVFIMGGEEGRDWMSPAVILNYINLFLSQGNDLLDIYDLYLMPVFNPDGYDYSMKTDRFWNRNRNVFFPHVMCEDNEIAVGVNIDRNFFLNATTYIPYSECDSIYTGHKTITEEEPKALVGFLNTIASKIMAFINVRGFSNIITVPYAVQTQFANNYAILIEMLLHASDKVYDKHNVSYNLCNTGSCFYNLTGNSPDWVKSEMNVPIVYTIYMNHKDSFLPNVEQIYTLTQHFTVFVQETLLLANNIYGPLFNSVLKVSSDLVIVVVSLIQIFIFKTKWEQ